MFVLIQVQAYTFLGQLLDLETSKLSSNDRVSYDVLKNILTTYTDGYTWKE